MNSHFAKYHGHGNDFIIIANPAPDISILSLQNHAQSWCNRHYGIGADGILLLHTSSHQMTMTVINADGSLAQNCGNGLRCAARWYFDNFKEQKIKILLANKEYLCELSGEFISVEMGECALKSLGSIKITGLLETQGFEAHIGNQHLIFVSPKPAVLDLQSYVDQVRANFRNSEEYNIGFVFTHADTFESYVCERAVGFTKSCGSGACAAACALAFAQDMKTSGDFRLCQPGGDIMVSLRVLQLADRAASFCLRQIGKAVGVFYGNLLPMT